MLIFNQYIYLLYNQLNEDILERFFTSKSDDFTSKSNDFTSKSDDFTSKSDDFTSKI